jgi:2-desacetyl-2-hydroxyethyl bacteriochlorophyllide A dehydrogenase
VTEVRGLPRRPGLPGTMAAAVYRGGRTVTVEQRAVPRPGPGEVLVEVGHCGVCGSDLHMILDGWGRPGSVLGHEYTGTVAAVGEGVTAWSVGEPVVGGPSPRCGRCRRCRAGAPSQCENRPGSIADAHDGAFAGYVLVDAPALVRLPAGLPARSAALAEPLAVALHGITRARIVDGDTVMVLGAGPIGALTVAALVARGVGPVTVVEPAEPRRALAREVGAAEVLDPGELEMFASWEPERLSPRAVDVVIECSGRRSAMEAGFHQLRRGGRLVLVGAGVEPPSFDPNRMILNELTVTGSFIYDADGFERALDLLASGTLPLDRLIDPADVPLDGLAGALESLASGRIAGKALVVPRLASPSSMSTPLSLPAEE